MITPAEQSEAEYNARDVLGMCRVMPHLVAALEQVGTTEVYLADEQMADLALEMTRIGLPVNSDRRAEIGERLRTLRDAAIERMREYTEGKYREMFLDFMAEFFAAKARNGEPVAGGTRIGPTRAAAELEAAKAGLAAWRTYRKELLADGMQDAVYMADGEETALGVWADANVVAFEEQVKLAKRQVKAAQFDDDEHDGLEHTAESAFEIRRQIRRAEAVLAIEKRGVNFGAKVQQCALLRAAAVPLLRRTEKSGLPKIDKEVLESVAHHPAAKALLSYILTEKTINVYIEGEKRAGKTGGKSRPVMVTEDGYIHPQWTIHKITGRWGSSPNCFDRETQILVREIPRDHRSRFDCFPMWKTIPHLLACTANTGFKYEVAQYEPTTGVVSFVAPERVFRLDYDGHLVRFKHDLLDLLVTDDHRLFMCESISERETELGPLMFRTHPAMKWTDPPASRMLRPVTPDQINLKEKKTHKLLAFRSTYNGLAPWLVDPYDVEITRMEYSGPVYCLTVPSSFIVVKRNEKICVTGQCQNWSVRAGGGAENLRAMIEAPEGYTLISADQKQIEARLIGAMSGCKYMLDTFREGRDIHGAFAAIGFPEEWPRLQACFLDHKKAKIEGGCKCQDCRDRGKMRDVTKRLEYGFFYGGKEQTLFESIVKDFPESTLGQVRVFIARLNQMLPEVLAWRQAALDQAIKDGNIRSPILGRLQVFPLGRFDPNVIYNFKAQSGAADIWCLGAQKFVKKWPQHNQVDVRLLQNGHDSVLILVKEALAELVERHVYECWNMVWGGVPFEMESKIVKRWSGD